MEKILQVLQAYLPLADVNYMVVKTFILSHSFSVLFSSSANLWLWKHTCKGKLCP
jgi:hypothetical protein